MITFPVRWTETHRYLLDAVNTEVDIIDINTLGIQIEDLTTLRDYYYKAWQECEQEVARLHKATDWQALL